MIEPMAAIDGFDLFADDPNFNLPSEPVAAPASDRVLPRFEGDTGELPERACYAYQELLKKEFVDRSSKNWPLLLDYRPVIASRLSELNLRLIVDEERGFAYKIEAEVDGGYSLLARKPIRWMDSVLLVYLRLQQALEVGRFDDTVVERRDIVEHLQSYRRPSDTDLFKHQQQIDKSIDTMIGYGILIPLTGTDRFLVAPVLSAAFPLPHIEALNQLYLSHARGAGGESGADNAEVDAAVDEGGDVS
jgi:Domain of unknown function (DUF4194)